MTFLHRAIHFRRHIESVPMHQLGHVAVIFNIHDDSLAFFYAQQRAGCAAVIADGLNVCFGESSSLTGAIRNENRAASSSAGEDEDRRCGQLKTRSPRGSRRQTMQNTRQPKKFSTVHDTPSALSTAPILFRAGWKRFHRGDE